MPLVVVLPVLPTVIRFSLVLVLTVAGFLRIAHAPRTFAIGAAKEMTVVLLVGFAAATAFGLPPESAAGAMSPTLCPRGLMPNVALRIAAALAASWGTAVANVAGSGPAAPTMTAVLLRAGLAMQPGGRARRQLLGRGRSADALLHGAGRVAGMSRRARPASPRRICA